MSDEEIVNPYEVIIRLVANLRYKPKDIEEIITKGKTEKFKKRYLKGYNSLSGKTGVTKIAKIIGISHGTLSPILKKWERLGIIYKVKGREGTFYKKLFDL